MSYAKDITDNNTDPQSYAHDRTIDNIRTYSSRVAKALGIIEELTKNNLALFLNNDPELLSHLEKASKPEMERTIKDLTEIHKTCLNLLTDLNMAIAVVEKVESDRKGFVAFATEVLDKKIPAKESKQDLLMGLKDEEIQMLIAKLQNRGAGK